MTRLILPAMAAAMLLAFLLMTGIAGACTIDPADPPHPKARPWMDCYKTDNGGLDCRVVQA